ncbi:MAG: hypothetical protein WCV99_15120 [Sterolibacterium sp.]
MPKQSSKSPQAPKQAKAANAEVTENPELQAALARFASVLEAAVLPPAKADDSAAENPAR